MPFITLKQLPTYKQMTWDDLFDGKTDIEGFIRPNKGATKTRFYKYVPEALMRQVDVPAMYQTLNGFLEMYKPLYEADRHSLYYTFKIPKKSGGYRTINAPNDELMTALRTLKGILETQFFANHHTAAFAYCKERSTISAVQKHQFNKSQWFLHLDFSDFFGSTTMEFVMSMLKIIFPFNILLETEKGKELFERVLDLCFLDGGLPQGTPISPLITNVMMIPIDHVLSNRLHDFDKHNFVYTRYADDIHISCVYDFDKNNVIQEVRKVLSMYNAPFDIKDEKTIYGNNTGSSCNWILGVQLAKDNNITVGQAKKKKIEATLFSFVNDYMSGIQWDLEDVQELIGRISYIRMVEQDKMEAIEEKINSKKHVNVSQMLKAAVSA